MTPAVAPAKPSRARSPIAAFTGSWASQIGITVAFLVVWLLFVIGAPSTFLNSRIYLAFAQTTPYFAIAALFLTMVIVAGDIDLSFVSIMSLSLVGFVFTWQATGSVELGVVACLAVGALCGLFNGFFVAVVGIPALVVTIATWFLFGGLTLVLVNGKSYPLVDTTSSFSYGLLAGRIGTIPIQFFWLIALAVVAWLLLNRHRLGQNAYAIGDNAQAAQLMGIPIRRTRITLFVLVGVASRRRSDPGAAGGRSRPTAGPRPAGDDAGHRDRDRRVAEHGLADPQQCPADRADRGQDPRACSGRDRHLSLIH